VSDAHRDSDDREAEPDGKKVAEEDVEKEAEREGEDLNSF
jgi:hypothetical protein